MLFMPARFRLFARNAIDFYDFVAKYDAQMVPVMKARGYICVHSMERTVAFTFGEFTFRRRRWKKGDIVLVKSNKNRIRIIRAMMLNQLVASDMANIVIYR